MPARLKEMVTAGNWPSWEIESGSFCVCTWVKVLSGTGVCRVVTAVVVAPPPPPAEAFVLAVVSTVGRVEAVEADDNAEVVVADTAVVLPESRAELDGAGDDALAADEGVSNALPVDGAAPEPAPEDEPAVFDATAADVPPEEDWM